MTGKRRGIAPLPACPIARHLTDGLLVSWVVYRGLIKPEQYQLRAWPPIP